MLSLLLRPLRQLVEVLLGNESTWQIAVGAALGAVIGLTPKDNLIAVTLTVLLFSLRINRAAGLLFVGLFSAISPLCDSFTHRLGAQLLTIESLQPAYAWLYDLPLGPWLGFNNTVVLGSLVLGLYVAYPVYALTHLVVTRCRAPFVAWLQRHKIARLLFGVELTERLGVPTLGLSGVMGDRS